MSDPSNPIDPPTESRHGDYLISDDPARIDLHAIHAYLSRSYWAEGIPLEVVARSVQNSLCIGVYTALGTQIGLSRYITDFATYCHIADVYILEAHRSQGLSKAMIALAMEHPRLQGLRRWNLVTQDAHGLYAQFGFVLPPNPERYMEKRNLNVYRRLSSPDAGTPAMP